uniref:hypothetical protein n=1 Tax=Salmonella sp. s51884 TaxID=3159654 RepID=UPI003980A8F0
MEVKKKGKKGKKKGRFSFGGKLKLGSKKDGTSSSSSDSDSDEDLKGFKLKGGIKVPSVDGDLKVDSPKVGIGGQVDGTVDTRGLE